MLQIIALGHLGADAEVKAINDKQYLSFRIASTERRNDQDETTWINVLAGNNEKLLPYLKKGQQVFVSGRMKAGIYQNNNNIGMDISVFASTLQLCGGKKEGSTTSNQAPYGSTVAPTTAGNQVPTYETVDQPATSPFPPSDNSDNLPF